MTNLYYYIKGFSLNSHLNQPGALVHRIVRRELFSHLSLVTELRGVWFNITPLDFYPNWSER